MNTLKKASDRKSSGQGSNEAEMLRAVGLKVTAQRTMMLRAVHRSDSPLTIQEVTAQVRKMGAETLSLATVYKNLHILESKGLVYRDRYGGYSPYDLTGLEQVASHSRTQIARMLHERGYSAEVFVSEMRRVEAEVAAALMSTATQMLARHEEG